MVLTAGKASLGAWQPPGSLHRHVRLLPELRQLYTLSSGLNNYSTGQQQQKRSLRVLTLQIITLPCLPGTLTVKWERTPVDSGEEAPASSLSTWKTEDAQWTSLSVSLWCLYSLFMEEQSDKNFFLQWRHLERPLHTCPPHLAPGSIN